MTNNIDELLLWGDLETTGLGKIKGEQTLEVALIVTDTDLNPLHEFGPLVFSATSRALEIVENNDYVHNMHTTTGLLDRVAESTLTLAEGDQQMVEFINTHFGADTNQILFSGNSIRLDRGFIERDFPMLDARLHYRQIDVSTVKELARLWYPSVYNDMPEKLSDHTAMTDIRESIKELRYYREHMFVG